MSNIYAEPSNVTLALNFGSMDIQTVFENKLQ